MLKVYEGGRIQKEDIVSPVAGDKRAGVGSRKMFRLFHKGMKLMQSCCQHRQHGETGSILRLSLYMLCCLSLLHEK